MYNMQKIVDNIDEGIKRGKEKARLNSELNDLLCCPFCKEPDFDLIGLKSHLEHGDCELYNNLESLRRMF